MIDLSTRNNKELKGAEYSFEVPMPKFTITFKLNLCLGATLSQDARLVNEGFIVTFWLGLVYAVALAMAPVKNKA